MEFLSVAMVVAMAAIVWCLGTLALIEWNIRHPSEGPEMSVPDTACSPSGQIVCHRLIAIDPDEKFSYQPRILGGMQDLEEIFDVSGVSLDDLPSDTQAEILEMLWGKRLEIEDVDPALS